MKKSDLQALLSQVAIMGAAALLAWAIAFFVHDELSPCVPAAIGTVMKIGGCK